VQTGYELSLGAAFYGTAERSGTYDYQLTVNGNPVGSPQSVQLTAGTYTKGDFEQVLHTLTVTEDVTIGVLVSRRDIARPNTSVLSASITTAQTAQSGVMTSADGSDIYFDQKWVTQAAYGALSVAITSAQATLNSPSATQPDVDNATAALTDALSAFNSALRYGTKRVIPQDVAPLRLGGDSRHSTMAQIVSQGFSASDTNTVVVAKASDFPDALSVAGFAGLTKAAIIITDTDSLTSQATSVLQNLKPSKVYVMGQENSISSGTAGQIKALTGVEPTRLAGTDRIGTSLAAYTEGKNVGSWSKTAFIANAWNFPDALAASPFAYVTGSPIFLSDPTTGLIQDTINAIGSGGFARIYLLGGPTSVPEIVNTQLSQSGLASAVTVTDPSELSSTDSYNVVRLYGANRDATSVLIAEESVRVTAGTAVSMDYDHTVITRNDLPFDALSGGALAGKLRSPLILVNKQSGDTNHILDGFLVKHRREIGHVYVLGDEHSVPASLLALIEQARAG
jgi:putative cell wall-binding protein